MFDFLKGKKTYIVSALMFVVQTLYTSGKISFETYQMLMGLLSAGAVSTVAAKINRIMEDKKF